MRRCEILAISSSGGHWSELSRLFPAFVGFDVEYATTDAGRAGDVPAGRFHVLQDANKQTPLRMVVLFFQVLRLIAVLRPKVVVSTGAAPGLLAVALGKLVGARSAWVDIFAGVERMTLSGRLARPFADVYLVQWQHLERPNGPHFRGSLL